ncbi:alkaline phosphatase family protein [Streptomyces physcomitrii]|uniref:alkaline phosphatase family protein n=1 Tax=Streptomyces physcomitrii TaxID=2724184 RepID=UPI001B3000B0|nr:alkaline phosphatase family protein [Streptomyces physcomitrii]
MSRLSRRSLLLGAAALAAAGAGPLASVARGAARRPKVLALGIDGALLSRIEDARAPRLQRLMAEGLTARSSIYAEPLAPTLSGPGWATVLTGVWPDKHRVRDNEFTGNAFDRYPDFLTRVEQARPELKTLAVCSWNPLTDTVISPAVDTRVSTPEAEYDEGTTRRAVAELTEGDPDAVFVHLDNVDHAGHGSGAASQEYLDAIAGVDAQVGRILDAVAARPGHGEEDWLILVTADHGHTDPGGHGGSSWAERQTFLLAVGGGAEAGSVRHDIRMPDLAAGALAHLGIALDPAWDLDGRPFQEPAADDFESLREKLGTAVDESGPGEALGFTHTPPKGWSVDNSAMGGGGITEWRGWTFTTDEFWTRAAPDQQRESNLRSRGVFAVADGDEWSDAGTAGTFDSTLVSPAYPVTGGAATLTYTTFYRQEGEQRGEVSVSWDGGAPQVLTTYTEDVPSRVEHLGLDVPSGAREATVRFRYRGGDNWFWALDGVRLTSG